MDKGKENKDMNVVGSEAKSKIDTMEKHDTVEDQEKMDQVGSVQQSFQSEAVKLKEKQSVEKAQEAKLRSKFPGAKSGQSEFLKKRLSKGRVYFDSGEYNMSKTKIENRSSTKPVSKTPTLIRSTSIDKETEKEQPKTPEPESHTENATEEEKSQQPQYGEKDNPLPEPEETAQQAIPTPELLFLRRASLHMPMSASEAQNASMPDSLSRRRYTAAPKGLVPTTESSAFPSIFEHESPPPFVSEQMKKRRSTLHVPSKLTIE